tara:strand:+ start:487 stop:1200 length:714 start_codon:yes stop_codon:yes gene_type:complete
MEALIIQPAGLGDIFFLIKIVKKLFSKYPNLKVTWPVNKHYSYINEYIKIENVYFINEEENFEHKDIFKRNKPGLYFENEVLVLNFSRADEIVPTVNNNKPMYCKYELAGLTNVSNWDMFVDIKRNYERESKLEKHFNKPTNFNLVNRVFATYPHIQKSDISNQKNEIEISNLGFDRIFDWCGLIEKCDNFYTVETSFCYLAKLLNKSNVFVYPRNIITNFKYVSKLFPADWKYITF